MSNKDPATGKGLLVAPDDLEVGQFYAVYGLKDGPGEPIPCPAWRSNWPP